jgi:hypothetical protein
LAHRAIKRLCVLGIMVISSHAQALIVLQQASASLGVEHDTNSSMSSTDKQSVWRYAATPRYSIAAVDEKNRWYSDVSLRLERSSDKRLSIDREDPTVVVGWDKEGERDRFSLIGRYVKTSTRFTEFDETGVIVNTGSSITRSVAANWSRLLTEKLNFSLGGQYLKTAYSGGNFTNFATKSLNSTLTYEWNEKVSPFAQISLTEFKPEDSLRQDTKSQNYLAGANVNLSPRFNFNASAGINHLSSAGNGRIANAGFNYLGEKYTVRGTISRSVSATSVGNFQESDRLSLGYNYELSDRSRLGADFSWRKNNSLNDSESKQLSGFYSKDLSEFWQLRLSLQHRNLKSVNRSANGNIAGITLTYNIPEF